LINSEDYLIFEGKNAPSEMCIFNSKSKELNFLQEKFDQFLFSSSKPIYYNRLIYIVKSFADKSFLYKINPTIFKAESSEIDF